MGRSVLVLPTGKLSTLKEIHISYEILGKHFDKLALGDTEGYERVVQEILSDLMDEDPALLSSSELYYAWLLVKAHSFGPDLSVAVH